MANHSGDENLKTAIESRKKLGTHAIVIGVGAYKYLPGGKGREILEQNEGMGQLSSPPESARSFTDRLLKESNNPKKPLASLQLLISDSNTDRFTLPDNTQRPSLSQRIFWGIKN